MTREETRIEYSIASQTMPSQPMPSQPMLPLPMPLQTLSSQTMTEDARREGQTPESASGATACATFSSRAGNTQIARSFCRAPLKIARAFAQPDGAIEVCVMDSSPGMLAGDSYTFRWHLEPHAHVFLTNQSFTKVHPSRENRCSVTQQIALENHAVLELFPQPTMLFRDADFWSETEVRLQGNARLLMSDIVCAGRQARGELFDFALWQSRCRVWRDDRLAWCNQTRLQPQRFDARALGAWHDAAVWGQFLLFDPALNGARAMQLVEILRACHHENSMRRKQVQCGVSALENGAIAATFLAQRAHDVQTLTEKMRLATNRFLSN